MLWLVWGIFLGWLVTIWQSSDVLEKKPEMAMIESTLLRALFFIFLGAHCRVGCCRPDACGVRDLYRIAVRGVWTRSAVVTHISL